MNPKYHFNKPNGKKVQINKYINDTAKDLLSNYGNKYTWQEIDKMVKERVSNLLYHCYITFGK